MLQQKKEEKRNFSVHISIVFLQVFLVWMKFPFVVVVVFFSDIFFSSEVWIATNNHLTFIPKITRRDKALSLTWNERNVNSQRKNGKSLLRLGKSFSANGNQTGKFPFVIYIFSRRVLMLKWINFPSLRHAPRKRRQKIGLCCEYNVNMKLCRLVINRSKPIIQIEIESRIES